MTEQRNLREIISVAALRRLETELHAYAHQLPRRTLPEYKMGAPKEVLPPPPPRVRDDGLVDRIYSRSDKQRYVLQLLATELHNSEEKTRTFVPFQTFKEVLGSPIGQNLTKLDPLVEDFPKRDVVKKVENEVVVSKFVAAPVVTAPPPVEKTRDYGRFVVDSTYSNVGRGIRVVTYDSR